MTEQHGTGLILIAMGIILKLLPENKDPGPRKVKVQQQPKQHEEPQELEEKMPLTSLEPKGEGRIFTLVNLVRSLF